jgi:ubiquinone/menaquinone biosynthesis C-methylase UbiE
MNEPCTELQLLIDLYDPLDPDRTDLEAYLAMVEEFSASSVVDLGCGTGVFAMLLAERGVEVVGVDPSLESLIVAQRDHQPDRVISIYGFERSVPLLADRVTWIHGIASDLPELQVDLVTCTGNAMQQAFVDDQEWQQTLTAVHRVLKPGGRFVFETRDPAVRAWRAWTPERSRGRTEVPGYGAITHWNEVTEITESPLTVTFRGTLVFERSNTTLVSSPETLRFREQDEISEHLESAGFTVDEIRDAPDRPGREWVYIARKR